MRPKKENNMANVIVLFEVTIKEGKMDDYLKMASSLRPELEKADGFIASERFSSLFVNGKILSKSEWKDEASVEKWRNAIEHRVCQQKGRMNDFVDYQITVVTPVRCYTMSSRGEAPVDSNKYFGA
jgi:heme-degrading monooxygenase HmoA